MKMLTYWTLSTTKLRLSQKLFYACCSSSRTVVLGVFNLPLGSTSEKGSVNSGCSIYQNGFVRSDSTDSIIIVE